jgi:hypothetical protein
VDLPAKIVLKLLESPLLTQVGRRPKTFLMISGGAFDTRSSAAAAAAAAVADLVPRYT